MNFAVAGVGALRGGLGAQTDVLLQHSFFSQLSTKHQQIRSVLLTDRLLPPKAIIHHSSFTINRDESQLDRFSLFSSFILFIISLLLSLILIAFIAPFTLTASGLLYTSVY